MPAKAVYYFYVKNGRETLLFKCGGMSFMKLGIGVHTPDSISPYYSTNAAEA